MEKISGETSITRHFSNNQYRNAQKAQFYTANVLAQRKRTWSGYGCVRISLLRYYMVGEKHYMKGVGQKYTDDLPLLPRFCCMDTALSHNALGLARNSRQNQKWRKEAGRPFKKL